MDSPQLAKSQATSVRATHFWLWVSGIVICLAMLLFTGTLKDLWHACDWWAFLRALTSFAVFAAPGVFGAVMIYRREQCHQCVHANKVAKHQARNWSGIWLLDLLTFWRYFPYILTHKARERVFEPAHQELREDYLVTLRDQGKWVRRWLTFCFIFRTVLMVLDSLWAILADRGLRFLMPLIPELLKRWWLS